jgi:hypothetical protein
LALRKALDVEADVAGAADARRMLLAIDSGQGI